MSLEANKQLARRYFEEMVGRQRMDLLEEIVAPDAVDETRANAGGSGGREDFRHHLLWFWGAVRDLEVTIAELVAEGDRVVVFWRVEGIHHATMFGIAATGKRFSGNCISTITIRGGKVARYAVLPDRLGIIQQFGATPA